MNLAQLEATFQGDVIKEITHRFPGAITFKTDPTNFWSFPDLVVLHGNKWAAFETKRHHKASKRPNQDYYVRQLDYMSFASFLEPGNKEEVLNALARHLA